eukprot:PhF_6_TR26280/c0_g1_i1/m.37649
MRHCLLFAMTLSRSLVHEIYRLYGVFTKCHLKEAQTDLGKISILMQPIVELKVHRIKMPPAGPERLSLPRHLTVTMNETQVLTCLSHLLLQYRHQGQKVKGNRNSSTRIYFPLVRWNAHHRHNSRIITEANLKECAKRLFPNHHCQPQDLKREGKPLQSHRRRIPSSRHLRLRQR